MEMEEDDVVSFWKGAEDKHAAGIAKVDEDKKRRRERKHRWKALERSLNNESPKARTSKKRRYDIYTDSPKNEKSIKRRKKWIKK
eukprot:UN29462